MTRFTLLADLVDLNDVLDADSAIDLEVRRQRDRRIGRTLQHYRNRPVAQIRAWLHELEGSSTRRNGVQGVHLYHTVSVALFLAGLFSGWALASAVLYYDGRHPINIVNAVVVLVLPQMLLLLVWVLATLPVRVPLFTSIASTLRFLNPGRLAGRLAGIFSASDRPGVNLLWNPDNAAILAPAARWLFSLWSQVFAFSFNIGILTSAFFLISFSDLAFVWSTTLAISNDTFHALLSTLSAPWNALLPHAVPSAELIESSRYYRLEEGALVGGETTPQLAVALGQWWPFLIAAIVCYGLLPRLLTLVVSWYRFRHHLRKAMCNLPGAPELLARMNSPLVSTLAVQPEHALPMPAGRAVAATEPGRYALRCPVIDWSGACEDAQALSAPLAAMGIEAVQWLHAGGRQSTEQDQALVTSLCRRSPEAVAVLVKAWEPPMLDLQDFLRGIRRECTRRMPLIVLLWSGDSGVDSSDRDTWQLSLGQLGDPDLHVEPVGQSA